MDVYAKIAKGLEESGRTQAQLAQALKWHVSKVSRGVRGKLKHAPTTREMEVIARFFRWPLDYLYDEDQTEPGPPVGLGEHDRYILKMVQELGFEESMDALRAALKRKEARDRGDK